LEKFGVIELDDTGAARGNRLAVNQVSSWSNALVTSITLGRRVRQRGSFEMLETPGRKRDELSVLSHPLGGLDQENASGLL
jgi:hypothetical protein